MTFVNLLSDNYINKYLKMDKFYCPYCDPKNQFQRISEKGTLICGLCEENLIKKPFFKLNQIIAFVAASSFLLPLIYTLVVLLKNFHNTPTKNYQTNMDFIIKKRRS